MANHNPAQQARPVAAPPQPVQRDYDAEVAAQSTRLVKLLSDEKAIAKAIRATRGLMLRLQEEQQQAKETAARMRNIRAAHAVDPQKVVIPGPAGTALLTRIETVHLDPVAIMAARGR